VERRNPLLAGFLNMVIPGSSHIYVGNDRRKFIPSFIGGTLMIFLAFMVGDNIQRMRVYTLPQGVCMGILVLLVFGYLFNNGMKKASRRNSEIDSAAHYQSLRTDTSSDDLAIELANIQKQRDEGLISIERYEAKKAEIESKEE
jgi:hypothetical protein